MRSCECAAEVERRWHNRTMHCSWPACKEGLATMHMRCLLLCHTWVGGVAAGLLSKKFGHRALLDSCMRFVSWAPGCGTATDVWHCKTCHCASYMCCSFVAFAAAAAPEGGCAVPTCLACKPAHPVRGQCRTVRQCLNW